MARAAKKIGADMVRSFKLVLRAELDLQRAHAEGNWEAAWKAAVELKRATTMGEKLMKGFVAAVGLPEVKVGNPGSHD